MRCLLGSAGAKARFSLRRQHRRNYKDRLAGCAAPSRLRRRRSAFGPPSSGPSPRRLRQIALHDVDAFPSPFQWRTRNIALERHDVMATHSSMRRGYAHASTGSTPASSPSTATTARGRCFWVVAYVKPEGADRTSGSSTKQHPRRTGIMARRPSSTASRTTSPCATSGSRRRRPLHRSC